MVRASEIKHFRASDGNFRCVLGFNRGSKTSDAGIESGSQPTAVLAPTTFNGAGVEISVFTTEKN